LVEIAELADHPWMLGTQFHPEFKSRPTAAHPLFRAFIKAADAIGERRREATRAAVAQAEVLIMDRALGSSSAE